MWFKNVLHRTKSMDVIIIQQTPEKPPISSHGGEPGPVLRREGLSRRERPKSLSIRPTYSPLENSKGFFRTNTPSPTEYRFNIGKVP